MSVIAACSVRTQAAVALHSVGDGPDGSVALMQPPQRNLAADFYRASGVGLIVVGHWLLSSVTYHHDRSGAHFGLENPLGAIPSTQWLTWIFQAVPLFFVVAGYAGALSWEHRVRDSGFSREDWLRRRLARVLGPTAAYVAVVAVVVLAFEISGVAGSVLRYGGWAVGMHLWFLSVYIMVVSLTPVAVAAQRRWGLRAPTVLAAAAVAVDLGSRLGHVQQVGALNYLLVWGLFYQLGIAWRSGQLRTRAAVGLGVGSGLTLLALVRFAHYPVSMIGVSGETVQNTNPPTVALMAFGCAQAGIAIAVAPRLSQRLDTPRARSVLARANANIMALYLWHMIPVVIVAVTVYPLALLPQPALASIDWWWIRLAWVAIVCLVAGAEMVLLVRLRRVLSAPLPTFGTPDSRGWSEVALLTGAALTAYSLHMFAAAGFAPGGHFASATAALFATGVSLVALHPGAVRGYLP